MEITIKRQLRTGKGAKCIIVLIIVELISIFLGDFRSFKSKKMINKKLGTFSFNLIRFS